MEMHSFAPRHMVSYLVNHFGGVWSAYTVCWRLSQSSELCKHTAVSCSQ